MDFMNKSSEISSILMIIVGIIMLLCPSFSMQTIGVILGIIILIVAAIILILGIAQMFISPITGVITFIIALLGLYLSWALIFDPLLVTSIFSLLVYLIGIIFILFGIFNVITGQFFAPFSMFGLTGIFFGIAFIIGAIFIRNPIILAIILGIWLIISGVVALTQPNDENYIDVDSYKYR